MEGRLKRLGTKVGGLGGGLESVLWEARGREGRWVGSWSSGRDCVVSF
jgi:hypothetical protein